MQPKYERIPETREELGKNQLPVCQYDLRAIAQVWGEEAAETTRIAAQRVRQQGGINPVAVCLIIPEGKDGYLDEHQLFTCIGNLMEWWVHIEQIKR